MTAKERMAAVSRGLRPDRIPFLPTILEHAAFLIDQTPSAVARSASLMERAHVKAYQLYKPDAIIVGLDVYNIEAEALGCRVRFYDDASIPGIDTHPYTLESDFKHVAYSSSLGRIQTVLDAAAGIERAIGNEVGVSVGICGPFSIMIELVGFETVIEAIYDEDKRLKRLLELLLLFQKHYCGEIASRGLGVTVFESWATPPLVSPEIYKEFAFPYERALLGHLEQLGVASRPLVIGGDTRAIVDDILEAGTTLLVSDYNTPLPMYVSRAQGKNILIRANIDPRLIRDGSEAKLQERVKEILPIAEVYPKLIAGTGVIPYDTPPENLLSIKRMLEVMP